MGKRSNFKRNKHDLYKTPVEAVYPLLAHVKGTFVEPCAGDGRLIRHLEKFGMKCTYACDIDPLAPGIEKRDVMLFDTNLPQAGAIITNPPWSRPLLHGMIDSFRRQAPTFLLFDTDWMHCVQAIEYLHYCSHIISVGRVRWFEGTNQTGKDNCSWYRFQKEPCQTLFLPRRADSILSEDERTQYTT